MREWTAPAAHEKVVTISIRPEFLVDRFLTPGVDVPRLLQAFVAAPRDAGFRRMAAASRLSACR